MIQSALVTGASGFIGSRLVHRLVSMEVETYALTRSAPDTARTNPMLRGAHVLSIDPERKLSDILQHVRTETVFHLAAAGVHTENDASEIIDGNVRLMSDLLLATSSWWLKSFIFTGSCFEYGTSSNAARLTEDSPLDPTSLYGAAKASAYLCGCAVSKSLEIPFVNLRLFGVYGPGEAPTRLLPYVISSLAADQPASLTGGDQIRDLLYVTDAVDALIAAAESTDLSQHDAYNICSSHPTRITDIVRAVAQRMNKPESLLRWGERDYRSDEPMVLVGCNQRFSNVTNWQPVISVENGIRKMVDSYNDQQLPVFNA